MKLVKQRSGRPIQHHARTQVSSTPQFSQTQAYTAPYDVSFSKIFPAGYLSTSMQDPDPFSAVSEWFSKIPYENFTVVVFCGETRISGHTSPPL